MTSYPTRRRQRLEGFDYSTAGCYAVTLCVQNRLPFFGRVVGDVMHHSPAGDMIDAIVHEIPSRYPGVTIELVVIMPDHVHLLLWLDGESASLSEIAHWCKSQSTARSARAVRDHGWPRFSGTLWQRGFYDRVIRKDEDLNAVRSYILTNPARWTLRHQQP